MKPHYRVLRFSPAPEFVEPVNVALLVVDEKPRILHDNTFAKLECVSGGTDLEMLRFWLRSFQEEIESEKPGDPRSVIAKSSGQFSLGEPREIAGVLTPKLEKTLMVAHLQRARYAKRAEAQRHYIDTLLDHLILSGLGMSGEGFRKRVSPDQFLSPEVRRHLKSNGFSISRVYPAKRGLVLLDGLNLEADEDTVKRRAQDIGYAYHAMESVKGALRDFEGKELIRTAIVFRPDLAKKSPKLEYAVESISRESDLVIHNPDVQSDQKELGNAILSVGESELELQGQGPEA